MKKTEKRRRTVFLALAANGQLGAADARRDLLVGEALLFGVEQYLARQLAVAERFQLIVAVDDVAHLRRARNESGFPSQSNQLFSFLISFNIFI